VNPCWTIWLHIPGGTPIATDVGTTNHTFCRLI
jgi:hypothetical protein